MKIIKFCTEQQVCQIEFANEKLLLEARGAIFWPATQSLIVADLHLEKASYLAKYGENLLPTYDTYDTLLRLSDLIATYKPRQVICLGDNLHDKNAMLRMREQDYNLLAKIMQSTQQWYWIMGNHDANVQDRHLFNGDTCVAKLRLATITLAHQPNQDDAFQCIGHYHPKLNLVLKGHKLSSKCFCVSENLIILPSFGSFTGGLDVHSAAFQTAFAGQKFNFFTLARNKIWRINH